MSSDISIFLQAALDMAEVEKRSLGQWRIFQKLGDGWWAAKNVGEINLNAYACLPVLDANGPAILPSSFSSPTSFTLLAM